MARKNNVFDFEDRELCKKEIVKAIRAGCTYIQACGEAAINKKTLYAWFEADPNFHRACARAKNRYTKLAVRTLKRKAEAGDEFSAGRLLQRQDRYSYEPAEADDTDNDKLNKIANIINSREEYELVIPEYTEPDDSEES